MRATATQTRVRRKSTEQPLCSILTTRFRIAKRRRLWIVGLLRFGNRFQNSHVRAIVDLKQQCTLASIRERGPRRNCRSKSNQLVKLLAGDPRGWLRQRRRNSILSRNVSSQCSSPSNPWFYLPTTNRAAHYPVLLVWIERLPFASRGRWRCGEAAAMLQCKGVSGGFLAVSVRRKAMVVRHRNMNVKLAPRWMAACTMRAYCKRVSRTRARS